MSVLTLNDATRKARKAYRCQLCNTEIRPGDYHRASTNVYDGRAYTWRECLHCVRDKVGSTVYEWAGQPDEGYGFDNAVEWASEASVWSRSGAERWAARSWLARFWGAE